MTKRKASVALDHPANENDTDDNGQNNNNNNNNSNNNNSSLTDASSGPASHQRVHNGSSDSSAEDNNNNTRPDHDSTNQPKLKKERADNWSSAEIEILHRGIETRRDIFYGPPNQATKKNRELAWNAITKEVNSVSTTPRSLSQVMKKFKNEKCRAKRKFSDSEKDSLQNSNNSSNNNIGSSANNTANNNDNNDNSTNNNNNGLGNQSHTNNNPQQQMQSQQQSHHLTPTESMATGHQTSMNVVKLAPQAKTMIDLPPGHLQQIQGIPSDDMVLIVPEMDSLLSGVNIVSDGNGHHHFQKCSGGGTLGGQQHSHHGHHTIQAINPGQNIVNGTMSNGIMARTIPGNVCSLVYSNEVCATDQHIGNTVATQNHISANHLSVNSQNLMHHRGSIDQQQQQQQQQQQSQNQLQVQQLSHHHHHLSQHPQQPHPQQQQQQQQQQHQAAGMQHQQSQQHQQPPPPNQPTQHHPHQIIQQTTNLAPASTSSNTGGVALESQLKNLLFNLLLKDGQQLGQFASTSADCSKQRNEVLTVIANSLTKIEGHLAKISKVVSLSASERASSGSNDNPPNTSQISNNSSTGNSLADDSTNATNNNGGSNLTNEAKCMSMSESDSSVSLSGHCSMTDA